MSSRDVLHPRESAVFISHNADHVKIHIEGIKKLSEEMKSSMKNNKLILPELGSEAVALPKDLPRAVDWLFVCDSLNFCFWSHSSAIQWTVEGHTGYYAMEAALMRAITEGVDITDSSVTAHMTEVVCRRLLRGDDPTVSAPLLAERIAVLQEVGRVLQERFSGTFETCVTLAEKSACKLLRIVLDNFPYFRDEAEFKGRQVSFYKRAQILVADLWNMFEGRGWGEFHDIDELTMFADYRVPQVLHYFGVLSYSDALMEKLKNEELLEAGSAQEVEIRGCSVRAVELLRSALAEPTERTEHREQNALPNAVTIDYWLWLYRRRHVAQLDVVPFHRTLGIYY